MAGQDAVDASWFHLLLVPDGAAYRTAVAETKEARQRMTALAGHEGFGLAVRVTLDPRREIERHVAEARADLCLLLVPVGLMGEREPATWVGALMASPPADLGVVALPAGCRPGSLSRRWTRRPRAAEGADPGGGGRSLVAIRGGPYAEVALRLARAVARGLPSDGAAPLPRRPGERLVAGGAFPGAAGRDDGRERHLPAPGAGSIPRGRGG